MSEAPFAKVGPTGCAHGAPAKDRPEQTLWELCRSLHPQAPTQRVLISTQPFTVGRDWDNALQLADATISRRHAELLLVDNDLFVRDISSRNGTFLNGHRISRFEKLLGGDRLQFGTAAFTVRPPRVTGLDSAFAPQATLTAGGIGEYALANLQFDTLLSKAALIPFFQPIVRLRDSQTVGYEVLARSRLLGLETPSAMFRVAAERGLEAQLSELSRHVGLQVAGQIGIQGELFLNIHPSELQGPRLIESLRDLRGDFPYVPIALEIHECAVASLEALAHLRAQTRNLGMRLAYDDFGVGQSRLSEMADVPPDVIKFDMSLIRGLSQASEERQNMVRSLVRIVRDLKVVPLAEGVETRDEALACGDFGFELAQGYFFGRPTQSPVT
ncbi:MAG TPA: EAL domain-containing protein [Planctomycetaceae bacterium]|jgi:EAL domain-containing protein (putative c-di-GMP-specific phosphodiesterase class I)